MWSLVHHSRTQTGKSSIEKATVINRDTRGNFILERTRKRVHAFVRHVAKMRILHRRSYKYEAKDMFRNMTTFNEYYAQ